MKCWIGNMTDEMTRHFYK